MVRQASLRGTSPRAERDRKRKLHRSCRNSQRSGRSPPKPIPRSTQIRGSAPTLTNICNGQGRIRQGRNICIESGTDKQGKEIQIKEYGTELPQKADCRQRGRNEDDVSADTDKQRRRTGKNWSLRIHKQNPPKIRASCVAAKGRNRPARINTCSRNLHKRGEAI